LIKSEVNTTFETDCEKIFTNHMGLYVDGDDKAKFENYDECYKKSIEDNYTEEEYIK
jgi:hypothetical protein